MGPAPSTISRDVSGVAGRAGYRATRADDPAWQATRRPTSAIHTRWQRGSNENTNGLQHDDGRVEIIAGPPVVRLRRSQTPA